MPAPDTGNEIIALLQSGNDKSLQCLFRLYYRPLRFFATRLLKDEFIAEDIVEESFIKLWQRKTDFANLQNIKAFLYISTKNACLNVLKQQQRDIVSKNQLAYLLSEKEEFILNEMVRSEVLEEVTKKIETLPGQCRKIFIMSFINGYKNHEIAAALRISVHTVKNQKIRAVQLLKVRLRDKNLAP